MNDTSINYPFQLMDVRLHEVHVERFNNENDSNSSTEISDEKKAITLNITFKIKKHEKDFVSSYLFVNFSGPLEGNPEFKVEFTLEGLFEVDRDFSEIDQNIWDEFKELSGLSMVWPYAREFTQNILNRMREDLPLLPTLNRLKALQKTE